MCEIFGQDFGGCFVSKLPEFENFSSKERDISKERVASRIQGRCERSSWWTLSKYHKVVLKYIKNLKKNETRKVKGERRGARGAGKRMWGANE